MLQFVWAVPSFKADAQNYVRGTIAQDTNGLYTGGWSPDGRLIILADASGGMSVWGIPKPG